MTSPPPEVRTAQGVLIASALGLLLLGPLLALQQGALGAADGSVHPWFGLLLGSGLALVTWAIFWGLALLCGVSAGLLGRGSPLGWGLGVLAGVLLLPACCVLPGVVVLATLLSTEVRAAYLPQETEAPEVQA